MLRRPTLVTLTTTLATALAGGAAVAALVGPAEARPGLPAGQGACHRMPSPWATATASTRRSSTG